MTRNEYLQHLFDDFQKCYIKDLSFFDRDTLTRMFSHLSERQIFNLLSVISEKRPDNYLPVPEKIRTKMNLMYPPEEKEVPKIDDCNKCFSTGLINCKRRNEGNYFNVLAYSYSFLCDCEHARNLKSEMTSIGDENKYMEWNKGLGREYLPVNQLIKDKFNNSYREYINNYKRIYLKHNPIIIPEENKHNNIIEKTNFKKPVVDIKKLINSDEKTLAN